MLLGKTPNNPSTDTELLVTQLFSQKRYADAYELLTNQQTNQNSTFYNIALCFHWSGNYQEALHRLERIQVELKFSNETKFTSESAYSKIRMMQNQTDDYLQGITESYITHFPASFQEAIVRLKTNCWLQLENFTKVITTATP
jgi:hypothetical protein